MLLNEPLHSFALLGSAMNAFSPTTRIGANRGLELSPNVKETSTGGEFHPAHLQ